MATLPYDNPDGTVVWDPHRGYVTVPRTNTVTVPGVSGGASSPTSANWQSYQNRVLGSQAGGTLENRGLFLPPLLRVPMPWDTPAGFDPTGTYATYQHNFSSPNEESQLAAAQAKWDEDMAKYDGVYPGGGIMGPRPTSSTPALMQGPTSPRISDQQMFDYYTQLSALKGADGTVDPAAAAAVMNAIRANAGYEELPGSIRTALSRFAGSPELIPVGSPSSQYNAANLQSLLDALGERGFNAPPPPPREPYRGPRDQTKEIYERRLQAGNNPDPAGGDGGVPMNDFDFMREIRAKAAAGGLDASDIARAKMLFPGDDALLQKVKRMAIGLPEGQFGDWRDDPRNGWGGGPVGPGDPSHGRPPTNPFGPAQSDPVTGGSSMFSPGVSSSGTGYTSGPMRDAPQSLPGTTSRWNDPRPGLGSPFPRPRETYGNPDLQGSGGWGRGWNPQGWRQGSPWDRTRPQMGGGWNQWPRGQQDPTQAQLPTDRMPRYQTPPWAPYNGRPGGDSPYVPPRPGQYVTGPAWGEDFNRGPQYTWGRGGGWGRGLPPRDPGDPGHGNYRPPDGYTGPLPSGMNGGGMPQPGGFRGWRS